MRVYIAGITAEKQYVKSIKSYYELEVEPGDHKQLKASGRGDIARIWACDDFLGKKEYDAILMLDLDMVHPTDMLKRLRAHDLDMVTAHYMARETNPIHSVCSAIGNNTWPFPPLLDVPEDGLHEIAVTGMGNVLIKREVVEAVAKRLPPGDRPFAIGPLHEATGDNLPLGSDFRFFTMARALGYKLWLDASMESLHGTTIWLGREIYEKLGHRNKQGPRLTSYIFARTDKEGMNEEALKIRIEQLEERYKDLQEQMARMKQSHDMLGRQALQVGAVLREDRWLLENWNATFPTLPEEEKQGALTHRKGHPDYTEEEAKEARAHVRREEAMGFVDDLNRRKEVLGDD